MQEQTKYQQLQPEDRMTMASMRQQGSSMQAMARTLGRSVSTISREFARNTLAELPYASHTPSSEAKRGVSVLARSPSLSFKASAGIL